MANIILVMPLELIILVSLAERSLSPEFIQASKRLICIHQSNFYRVIVSQEWCEKQISFPNPLQLIECLVSPRNLFYGREAVAWHRLGKTRELGWAGALQ